MTSSVRLAPDFPLSLGKMAVRRLGEAGAQLAVAAGPRISKDYSPDCGMEKM